MSDDTEPKPVNVEERQAVVPDIPKELKRGKPDRTKKVAEILREAVPPTVKEQAHKTAPPAVAPVDSTKGNEEKRAMSEEAVTAAEETKKPKRGKKGKKAKADKAPKKSRYPEGTIVIVKTPEETGYRKESKLKRYEKLCEIVKNKHMTWDQVTEHLKISSGSAKRIVKKGYVKMKK